MKDVEFSKVDKRISPLRCLLRAHTGCGWLFEGWLVEGWLVDGWLVVGCLVAAPLHSCSYSWQVDSSEDEVNDVKSMGSLD